MSAHYEILDIILDELKINSESREVKLHWQCINALRNQWRIENNSRLSPHGEFINFDAGIEMMYSLSSEGLTWFPKVTEEVVSDFNPAWGESLQY